MSRWKMLMGSAVLWLTACGAGTPAVLETDQTTYAPGAQVMLRLGNKSLQPLGYNLCFTALQRLEGQDWVVVPRPETAPREVCPAYQAMLNPGSSSSSFRPLDASLPEGEYRYRTNVELQWDEERMELVSNSFRVVSPSTP